MTDMKPAIFDASTVFYRNVDQEPVVDLQGDQEYARPRKGEEPILKWLGGDMATGPWVYWVQLDAGQKAAPHKWSDYPNPGILSFLTTERFRRH